MRNPTPPQVRIFVKELEIAASVGVYDHERSGAQRLIFDIEVSVPAACDDTLASTIDYDAIIATVQSVVARGHYHLVETIAKTVSEELFRDVRIQEIMVQIAKPAAVKMARAAGVVWRESRDTGL